VNDQVDSFKQNGVLGVGVLNLLGLGRLLRLVQNRLQTLGQSILHRCIVYSTSDSLMLTQSHQEKVKSRAPRGLGGVLLNLSYLRELQTLYTLASLVISTY